ncbi:MAG TPA: amino acid permease [Pirellulaceae bacterium]|nr:amino acid permease [Pirellulaceae bacterium]
MSESSLPSQPPASPSETLPRLLGPFDAVMLVVGSIIGSGIFLKVSNIDNHVPAFGPILAVWIIGGLATLCGSLSLAELAAMLPHAGGPYVYLREAYGRMTAFLWGWAEFSIIRTGSLGSLACGTVIYFNRFLESTKEIGLMPGFLEDFVPLNHVGQGVVTILAVLSLTWINVIGTRHSARTQNITTVIKVGFLMVLMLAPLLLGKWDVNNLQPIAPANYSLDFFKAFGLAMVAVFWPYDGWINMGPVAEEIREPQRNVPIGLGLGIVVVTLVYVGAIIGYHFCLPMSQIRSSGTVAADVFEGFLGKYGIPLAAAGVMISMFGALNSNLLAGPRIYFAMARDGLFPRFVKQIHSRYQTPSNAVLVQSAWSIIQIVLVFWIVQDPKDAFDTLTDFVILGGTFFYALVVGAVFVLRAKMPTAHRPYSVWGYPFTPALYLLVAALVIASIALNPFLTSTAGMSEEQLLLAYADQLKVPAVAGLMLVGVGLYFVFRRLEGRSA